MYIFPYFQFDKISRFVNEAKFILQCINNITRHDAMYNFMQIHQPTVPKWLINVHTKIDTNYVYIMLVKISAS